MLTCFICMKYPDVEAYRVVRWRLGCQPYAPAVLHPPKELKVLISGTGRVNLGTTVRKEGLGKSKKYNDFIGTRTRNLPTCSITPQPSTLPHALQRRSFLSQKSFMLV
jgi:hypothetical protein